MKRSLLFLGLSAAACGLGSCDLAGSEKNAVADSQPGDLVLTVAAPAAGAVLAQGPLLVTGTAVAEGPAQLTLAVDGGAPSPVEVAEGGSFSVEIDPAEGAHMLRLVLVDGLARRAEREIPFSVAASPGAPVLALISPAAGAELPFGPISVAGTAEAEAGLASLVLSLDGGDAEALEVGTDGSFSVSIEAGEGSHTIRLELVDARDRSAAHEVEFTLLPPPDQTAPTLSVAPVPAVTTVRQVELRGVATDDRELAGLRLITAEGEQVLDLAGDGSFEVAIVPRNGANELQLVAVDRAGNESAQTISFFYGSSATAGAAHAGVIRDGAVWAWGRHNKGQVGVGGETSDANAQLSPQPVAGLPRVHWISFAQNSSVAVGEDGTVWTWGANDDGQLGLGLPPEGEAAISDTVSRSTPHLVPGIGDAVAAAAGYNHVLVLRADGTVMAFGRNGKGQLGDGTTTGRSWPMPVSGIDRVVKVVAGSEHSAALRDDGTIFLFGRNTYGNLAQGGIDTEPHPMAVEAMGLGPAVDLATGRDHVVALHADGTASSWGLNASGQLGDGTEANRGTPAPVLDLEGCVALSANGNYTLARKADGSLWGWGQGSNAQFGTGESGNVATPTAPAQGLADVVAAGAGATHVVAVRADGTVFTWGWNIYGSLGNPLLPHNWSVPTPTALELPVRERWRAVEPGEDRPGGATTVDEAGPMAFSRPLANLPVERWTAFSIGDSFFDAEWFPAPHARSDRDGLGPLFHADSCLACHVGNGRGAAPEGGADAPASLLFRISLPDGSPHTAYGDQLQPRGIAGVSGEARIDIAYEELEGRYGDGEAFSLRRPHYTIRDAAYGEPGEVLVSPRITQQLIGLGLLAAIPDEALSSMEDPDDRDGDGISGRANRVIRASDGATVIGRFGWKANQPDLQQQNAAALRGDLGITTPLFPDENCGAILSCGEIPHGGAPEFDQARLDALDFYTHALAVPARRGFDSHEILEGKARFHEAGCASCHRPSLTTGEMPSLPELGGQAIWPYTDLLLHDLGDELADGRPDGDADGNEWRTPPLWGIGLTEIVGGSAHYLHDGRARTIAEAILWHGGEAHAAREAFRTMPAADRAALQRFVESL